MRRLGHDRQRTAAQRGREGVRRGSERGAAVDPVAWMLDRAPLDDALETEEERRAVAEAHADRQRDIGPAPPGSVPVEFDGER
jgi:hypothetical protein